MFYSSDTGFDLNTWVEQCKCPPGYTGSSCHKCSPGYERRQDGTCRQSDVTCPNGYYENPSTGRNTNIKYM